MTSQMVSLEAGETTAGSLDHLKFLYRLPIGAKRSENKYIPGIKYMVFFSNLFLLLHSDRGRFVPSLGRYPLSPQDGVP